MQQQQPLPHRLLLCRMQEQHSTEGPHSAAQRWLRETPRANPETLAALAAATAKMCALGLMRVVAIIMGAHMHIWS